MTKEERLLYQREYRKRNNNLCTKKYEKSIDGFLMRLYRNMKSRIDGVQKKKAHLYENKELFSKQDFYSWAKDHPSFLALWQAYQESSFERKKAPSVDRIDSSKGYSFDNVEWVTHSENSRRGAVQRHQKNSSHS
jgi:hypothetical protein